MRIAHCDHSRDKSISMVESHVNSDDVIMRDLRRSNTEIMCDRSVQCAIGTKNPEKTVVAHCVYKHVHQGVHHMQHYNQC